MKTLTQQTDVAIAETGHTPGPWDDASNYPEFDSVRIFAGTHYIATVGNSDDPKELTKANARLIACAPDLLATLETIAKFGEQDGTPFALSAAKTARAAIAKAQCVPGSGTSALPASRDEGNLKD